VALADYVVINKDGKLELLQIGREMWGPLLLINGRAPCRDAWAIPLKPELMEKKP
jgi:hypothetical protein